MERKIYKYPLLRIFEQELLVPRGFEPLKVERVGQGIFLWGIIDPYAEPHLRRVNFVGTGEKHDFNGQSYIGTIFDLDGLVWHIFIDKAA